MTGVRTAGRWIAAEELRQVFDLGALVAALEEGHRGPRAALHDGLIGPGSGRYLIRSAAGGGLVGSKLITIFPDNPRAGRPGAHLDLMVAAALLKRLRADER